MDEYQWVWMHANWLQDQEEENDKYRDYATFIGSFYNYDMAQKIFNRDNNSVSVSDEEHEEAYNRVVAAGEILENREILMKRRRRVKR